jgi:transposase
MKPWRSQGWCIPPEGNAEFVAAMENILAVYTRKRDKKRPLVYMDECPKQLTGEVRTPPLPCGKGKIAKYDAEYARNGNGELFMFAAPPEGWWWASPGERRTHGDWAREILRLVDVDFPDTEKIVLVMDNLNTHTAESLYETFPPAEAKRIRDKLEIHYIPKHGSWLNMAEIEIRLSKRVPAMEQMKKDVKAWNVLRNKAANKINWRFTTENARIKLYRLYPLFV